MTEFPAVDLKPPGAAGDSLVRRLTRLNLLVLTATMLLTFALVGTATWFVARDRQMQSAELSAQLLANSVAPMLVFVDADAAHSELQSFSRRSDLLEVQVHTSKGALFAHWDAAGAAPHGPLAPPPQLPRHDSVTTTSAQALEVWVPVRLKGEHVGVLVVRESLQSLHRAVLLLSGVAAALIALAIWAAARGLRAVQRSALAPLVELSDLAERMSREHNYSRRAKVHRRDEVGRLTERFNDMLKRIEIWQADLHQQLEQEQEAGQHLHRLAHCDSLTGLPNRLFFQGELQRHLAHSAHAAELMALMFIDLDNFKTVNDEHGHDTGDAVLCEVARRMAGVVRARDVLCRLGGDEFALILPALPDQAAAEQLARRLIEAVRAPLRVDGRLMPIGATVGLAFFPLDAGDPGALLNASDRAMYAAKRAGKNTYRRARDAQAD
ncbi:sensor domain-containing diguanylate cyclase [Janthinobacterium fluminis]|uniref:Diguanylate cyclase n=1 Tax=Janthinobacterium fluminis TaxID=2987524 RepID=A0ABT5JVG7_9BURK|nr:sensor domain-containing diguanylate cyclase [Janthinobacterium fluminis]MDC8756148.1 diguanylate cyclase [Janthinobacterium fluminis]